MADPVRDRPGPDYPGLIRPDRVHGSLYTDPRVFADELARIWYRTWVYVGHESEVRQPGDYVRPEFRRTGEPMRWFGTTQARVPGYVARMREACGEAAEQILIEGAPHVMVFPNLFVAEIQVFVIQPVSAGECVHHSTAVQLAGAPELNRRMISQSVGSVGPAGMLLADDTEMYERNQRGVAMLRPEWLDLRRGLHRERTDERGLKVGTATDETAMRGFWVLGREGSDVTVGANFVLAEARERGMQTWAGRVTYRLRLADGGIRLAGKQVLLVNRDQPLPTLAFLI